MNRILHAGRLRRIDGEENWCNACQKSTIWWAEVWSISLEGVDLWGTMLFCRSCKTPTFKDSNGVEHEVELTDCPGKESNDKRE